MDVGALNDAVAALERPADTSRPPIVDPAFASALRRLVPARGISLNDLWCDQRRDDMVDMFEAGIPEEPFTAFWEHFWSSIACCYTHTQPSIRRAVMATADFYSERQWHATSMYVEVMHPAGVETELVVPLPGPRGAERRLLFMRDDNRPFTDDERMAIRLLRPHVVEALRRYERTKVAGTVTPRQREVVTRAGLGEDNRTIARELGMSPETVRKHLENAFVRLGVMSRSAAVAALHPDASWD